MFGGHHEHESFPQWWMHIADVLFDSLAKVVTDKHVFYVVQEVSNGVNEHKRCCVTAYLVEKMVEIDLKTSLLSSGVW